MSIGVKPEDPPTQIGHQVELASDDVDDPIEIEAKIVASEAERLANQRTDRS